MSPCSLEGPPLPTGEALLARRPSSPHPRAVNELCSVETLAAGEPLVGTASVGKRYLLISWPKGQWAEKALKAPELAPIVEWAARHDAARNDGNTVLRLFSAQASPAGLEVRAFPAGVRLIDVPLVEAAARLDALFEDLDAGRPHEDAAPCPRTLAVCTHGKHDRCCAQFGQSAYRALAEAADALGAEVVESTHLGGHRFAATLVDLRPGQPGRMYGRLRAEEMRTLVRHLEDEQVWLERYRGRVDLPPEKQIVEAEALARGAVGDVTIESIGDDAYLARWTGGSCLIRLRIQRFECKKSCGEPPESWTRPVLAG